MDALEKLYEEHFEMVEMLGALKHRRWLAGLPKGYVSLRAPGVMRQELSVREQAELLATELKTRLRLLEVTTEIHELKFGSVPLWVGADIAQLWAELDQAFM